MLPKRLHTVRDASGRIDPRADRLIAAFLEAGFSPEEAVAEAQRTLLRRRQAELDETVDRLTRDFGMGF